MTYPDHTDPHDATSAPLSALDIQHRPTASDDDADPHSGPPHLPAADDSPLAALRARRAQMAEQLYIDVRVPGWGEPPDDEGGLAIYVRCRPIRPSELNGIREKRRKSASSKRAGAAGWVDLANADVLVTTCLEVWGLAGGPRRPADVDEDERLSLDEAGLHGPKTRFTEPLARTLGMMDDSSSMVPTPVEVVRYLFMHDGAVLGAANRIIDYSGLSGTTSDDEAEDFTGS